VEVAMKKYLISGVSGPVALRPTWKVNLLILLIALLVALVVAL
jgi:hypothetical protein